MTRKDPALFLEDILEAMNKIEKYTKDKDIEKFRSDSMTVDAVLRNLEVIDRKTGRIMYNQPKRNKVS